MPVGDSHLAFAEAAARDGITLSDAASFTWLTELGHIRLEHIAAQPPPDVNAEALSAAADVLDDIYLELGGDIDVLVACRATLYLPVDLVHAETATIIELDESHHFNSFRLATIDAYPADARVGFDLDAYRELCAEWAPKMDKFNRHQAAKGFGIGAIQRERAYRDAFLDLAAPAMGRPPVVRILALDGDGAAAYERTHEALPALLGAAR